MSQPIDNLRIRHSHPLISPAVLAEEVPLTGNAATLVATSRAAIADVVSGRDRRLLVIVGPCSVHDLDAVRTYAERLEPLARELADNLLIVMRVYFEKPRTTIGWKGYINDPTLDGRYLVNRGLREARRLLAELTELGLPCATEFLDTTFGQYYADYIAWGAIGARTVESQIHRQLASGLSMPVGIKNGTNGSVEVALDAIQAAGHPHLFPSLTREGAPALLETSGNPDCHLVLRGGGGQPNFDAESVAAAMARQTERGISNGIVVDCSHGNSAKQPERQREVARAIAQQRRRNPALVGLMLESHLLPGRQDSPRDFGRSITDACLGWEATAALLKELCGQSKVPE